MAGRFVDVDNPHKCGSVDFYRQKIGRACVPCSAAAGKAYRAKYPERAKAISKQQDLRRVADGRSLEKHLRLKYGMTIAQRDEMFEAQGSCCAICRTDKPPGKNSWHIDHDHDTGAVRGILCGNCNTGIGMLADDPDRILAAAQYLLSARAKEE